MRITAVAIAALVGLAACDASKRSQGLPTPTPVGIQNGDSAFDAMEHRHGDAVGVDPMAMAHQFAAVPEGGDITLERQAHDDMGITQIRSHLLLISRSFKRGDFTIPGFIHVGEVPGAAAMGERSGEIDYTVEDLPHGGVLRIRTTDARALQAIHSFIAFQIAEHRMDR